MSRRRKGRSINGILLIDKPLGISSNGALQKVKHLFEAAKAGHTGSLDPLATGVLPICLGEATKFTQFLLDADKCYRATFRFGMATVSGDADGEVIIDSGAPGLTEAQLVGVLGCFRGDIDQIPPMFSALKHQGQPLYKLAREGVEIEREARPVTIHSLELVEFRSGEFPEADMVVHCSKGTYIRTLAIDIGQQLGCGAYLSVLRRTAAGPFIDDQSVTLAELQSLRAEGSMDQLDRLLLPMDAGMMHLAAVDLVPDAAFYFRRGQAVMVPQVYRQSEEGDIVRVFEIDQTGPLLLGVGEVTEDGRVAPKRLVVR
ncbi:tRNA pseudouridine(55) synthase TruB [Porticoccus sp.]|uniref:tRNA pseudouridine(55) synthase TruB n=1 Tax=Porticoccus sp. TaxID=2024853 RepID=UPI003F69E938